MLGCSSLPNNAGGRQGAAHRAAGGHHCCSSVWVAAHLIKLILLLLQVGVKVPLIVRLEGTNVERGKEILRSSGMDLITARCALLCVACTGLGVHVCVTCAGVLQDKMPCIYVPAAWSFRSCPASGHLTMHPFH